MILGRTRLLAIFVISLILAPCLNHAARAQVVGGSCSASMSNVVFGSIDVLPGSSIQTNGTLSVTCTGLAVLGGTILVCVNFPPRSMVSGTTPLAYDLYGPPPATTSWSNTTPISVTFGALQTTVTVHVNVPAAVLASQQMVPPGAYNQTLASKTFYGTANCMSGGSTSFSFQATATVVKSCNVSASNLDFGAVGDLNTIVDGQSSLTLQCTKGTGYSVSLNGGLSGATDPAARKMTSGAEAISYGLFQNGARSTPWGVSTNALGGTGSASVQTIPVYGRVPVQPTPSVGTYSDTIVVSVTY